jgi:hypothetical protein
VYLFGTLSTKNEEQLVIVGATAGRFSLARILKPAAAGQVTSASIQ